MPEGCTKTAGYLNLRPFLLKNWELGREVNVLGTYPLFFVPA